jgi:hypothetical protein
MPHHLISDTHEWINEIPTVPIYYLVKPQPREQCHAWYALHTMTYMIRNIEGDDQGSILGYISHYHKLSFLF